MSGRVEPVRWGVLSTARIGHAVVGAASASQAADVVAVASRSAEAADAFAAELGIGRSLVGYEALLADPEVEAVYIPLPNGLHVEWTLRALEAGKHVLVEKPFTPRAEEAERCFDLAERHGLVLSEGFMWRHHPQADRLAHLVRDGAIGELRLVRATFSFQLGLPGDVRWEPALDGGALLDVGTYCMSAARLLAGEPERVSGESVKSTSGVDSRFVGQARFPGGVLASFDCGFDLPTRSGLEVVGAEGSLFLADPWSAAAPVIELRPGDGAEPERIEVERADAYRLELEDVSAAIRGEREARLGRADAVGQARALEALLLAAAEGRSVTLS